MAISPEVLNDALQDLAPTYSNLFERFSPVLQKIVDKGNIERNRVRGPFKEFRVVTDGPGDVTQIVDGGEVLASTRKDITAKGSTYGARMIYSFLVPDKDMAEATGPADVEHIIKQYPEAGLMDFHQRIAKQLMNGNGTNVGGFLTFNGDTTYASQDGTNRAGAFEFQTEASQTDQVFGLTKNTVSGWFNGYRDISSMASDGISKLRQAYFGASRRGKMSGPVDLLLADELSYTNYIDLLDDRIIVEDAVKGEGGAEDLKQGIKFLAATMFLEEFLEPTDTAVFGAAAQDGVIYGLKTSTWHAYTLGSDAKMETTGDFAIRGPLRRPDMDAHQFEYVLYMGMYCDMLSANFAVTGGRIP
tara:strand:+ start:703 stop:1779 length:1077 start_codon:yes stop_codon:yes gene_type:complete